MASPSTCGFSLLLRQRQTATGKLQRLRTCFLFFEDSKGVFLGKGDVRPQRHGDTEISPCLGVSLAKQRQSPDSALTRDPPKDRLLCRHSISDTIQRLFARRAGASCCPPGERNKERSKSLRMKKQGEEENAENIATPEA